MANEHQHPHHHEHPHPEPVVREIDITTLINRASLRQQAATMSIIDYEFEMAQGAPFALVFHPLIPVAYRLCAATDENPYNCLVLSAQTQFTPYCKSIFIKLVDVSKKIYEFIVFDQGSYSRPAHRYVDLAAAALYKEKEAITNLLRELASSQGTSGKLVNTFVAIYQAPEQKLHERNNEQANPALIIDVRDLPSTSTSQQDQAVAQHDLHHVDPTPNIPPVNSIGIDQI